MTTTVNTLQQGPKPFIVNGLVATGTNQATAFPLTPNTRQEFITVASGSGAILPVGSFPCEVTVANAGLNALLIYPPVGGTIANGSANASASLAAGSSITYWASSQFNWYVTTTAGSGGGGGGATPAGSTGQLQTNAGGGLLGAMPAVNGDGTLNTTTGALAVTASGGVNFGALAFLNTVPSTDEPAYTGVITTSAGGTVTSFSGTGALPAAQMPALTGAIISTAGTTATTFGAIVLPSTNFPALTGAITTSSGSLATSFGSVVLPATNFPALTGAVVTTAGALATTFATIATLTGLINATGGTAAPSATTLSAWMDAVFGTTEGAIVQRGVTVWQALAPGTAHNPFESGGNSALGDWNSHVLLPSVGPTKQLTGPIVQITGSGAQITNSSALTSIFTSATFGSGQSLTIPANTLSAGRALRMWFSGNFGCTASTPTFFWEVLLGATVIIQSGLNTLGATATTNGQWYTGSGGCVFHFGGAGSSGTVLGAGALALISNSYAAVYNPSAFNAGSTGTPQTIDFTSALAIDIKVQFGTASTSNNFQLTSGFIEIIG